MITPEQAEQIRQKLLEQVAQLPAEQQAGLQEQIAQATPEQLEAYIKPAAGAGECLFCSISKGKIETHKIFEDNSVVAFLDITPSRVGQVILTTKEHYQFLFQIPDHVLWDMVKAMKVITPLMVNLLSAEGVSTYFAQGEAAGQMVEHFSINLIPRFADDKAVFAWDRKQADKAELERVAKEISDGVQKTLKEEHEKVEKKVREKMENERVKSPDELPQFKERSAGA